MKNRRIFLVSLMSLPFWRTAAAVEFAPVSPDRKLVFPADYGAHPNFRTEWWYATGWLSLPDGSPLGFQATFFRVRSGVGENNPSTFAPRQIIFAHASITDPRLGHLLYDQRAARVGFGRAGFEVGRTKTWVGNWRFEQHGGRYRLDIRATGFSYALNLVPDGLPVLNGIAGFSKKASDQRYASYYYSRPQLKVSGTVTSSGAPQVITGHAWIDHEWSSELIPNGAQGWDWIGLNLDDGSAVMAFRLRDHSGSPTWSAATFRQVTGNKLLLSADAVSFKPLRNWHSTRTGIIYPVEWHVRVGPRLFHLQPLIDDQELDCRRSTGNVYWEGAVRVAEGGQETGRGYLEMTGYGERLRVGK